MQLDHLVKKKKKKKHAEFALSSSLSSTTDKALRVTQLHVLLSTCLLETKVDTGFKTFCMSRCAGQMNYILFSVYCILVCQG